MFKLIEQHAHDLFHVYRAVCRNFCDQNFLTSRISAVRSSYCLGRSVLISRSVTVSLCSFIGIYTYRPVLVTHHSMWATLLLHNRKAACWHFGPKIGYPDCCLFLVIFFSGRSRDGLSKYVVDPRHSTSIPLIIWRYIIIWYIHSVVQHLHEGAVNLFYVNVSKCIWLNERLSINALFSGKLWVLCQTRNVTDNYAWVKLLWGTWSVLV